MSGATVHKPAMAAKPVLKRRRTEERVDLCPIHRLTDELLVEILARLRRSQFASQCKTVCKRWLSLIDSDPLFLRTFIRRRRHEDGEIRLPFGFFVQYWSFDVGVHKYYSKYRVGSPSLSFLPCEDPDSIWILASHNDLLVCCPNVMDHSVYYLCNLVTKQWLSLPPPPFHERARAKTDITGRIRVGFVCEPYYHCSEDDQNHVVINREYSFRLVSIPPILSGSFEVGIYSSDTGEWTKTILQMPPCNPATLVINTVAYKGKLHWLNFIAGYMDIFGYDPREHDAVQCDIIHRPLEVPRGVVGCFGLFRGRFRVCAMQTNKEFMEVNDTPGFSIWELKDYNRGEWVLLRKFCFDQFRCENSLIRKYARSNGNLTPIESLAFHPFDEDVMFFQFPKYVAYCNMRTRRLRAVGEAPHLLKQGVFPVVCPWWPTPLPRLQHIVSLSTSGREGSCPETSTSGISPDGASLVASSSF